MTSQVSYCGGRNYNIMFSVNIMKICSLLTNAASNKSITCHLVSQGRTVGCRCAEHVVLETFSYPTTCVFEGGRRRVLQTSDRTFSILVD